MAIECPCPGCGVVLGVPEEHAGKQARCPECSQVFVVPQESALFPAPEENRLESPPDSPISPPSPPDSPSSDSPAAVPPEAASLSPQSAPEPAIEEISVAEEAPPDLRQWWLKTPQGAVYGPISKDQLDIWCEEGRIADDCQVKHEEELAWRNADLEYPLLSQEAPPVAPFAMSEASISPAQTVRPTIVLPHRGVVITALGVASWITLICPIFGAIAWNMGNRDMELMYAGQMDASGLRITNVGRMLGLLHVLVFLAVVILSLGFAVIYLVMR